MLICVLATPAQGAFPWTWRNGRQREALRVVEKQPLAPGESLLGVMLQSGVDKTEAYAAARALEQYLDPKKLLPGTPLELHLSRTEPGALPSLAELRVPDRQGRLVTVLRFNQAAYAAASEAAAPAKGTQVAENRQEALLRRCVFTIGVDLASTAKRRGVALPVLRKAENLLKKEIDLRKDIVPGDTFAIVWKEYDFGPKKKRGKGEELLAFALKSKKKSVKVFRFTDKSGAAAYYDASGTCVNRPLTVLPVASARITSKFGMREHPVLGGHRMHRGIDVAATPGTPVHAAADGTVVRKGWGGGYGRIVALRHPTGLETRYAHLSGFAKKLRMGQKVTKGDVVGYVGFTGRVTGPHLHFEVLRAGAQVNPLKFNLEETVQLSAAEREEFAIIRRRLEKQLSLNETTVGDGQDPATQAIWKISG